MSSNNINQQLSLYIPFVFNNITEERIRHVFNHLTIGVVDRVDFVDKVREQDGKSYKMAFVHFKEWYSNEYVAGIQNKMMSSSANSTRIVYDDPWYWNVFMNNKPRTVSELALERELAIAKAIMASERSRGDYFQMIASTWNIAYPHDCARIHNSIPLVAYQPVDIDPIEEYGTPWVIIANPSYGMLSQTQHSQGYVTSHAVDPMWENMDLTTHMNAE
jgi:hypothetical protein